MKLEEFTNNVDPNYVKARIVKFDKRLFGHSVSLAKILTFIIHLVLHN